MSARYFLDTNVFVYSFDRSDRRKQKAAEGLVEKALTDHLGLISSQVVQEFLSLATTKFTPPLKPDESRAYLETVLSPLCEVFPTMQLYRDALAVRAETRYSFYDSLIIAAALEGACAILYSEDLHTGQIIRGLKIINPFQQTAVK